MNTQNINPNTNSSISQTRAILAYMRAGHAITPREARQLYHCDRLGARIKDIERIIGYPPERKFVTVHDLSADGQPVLKKVMSYWLNEEDTATEQ